MRRADVDEPGRRPALANGEATMPSKTTTRLGRGVGTVALALGAVVGPLAAEAGAASVVTSSSVLAPNLVSTGRTAFYSATWANQSRPTLTNTAVVITLPAGSALVSADPAVCTVALPSGGSGRRRHLPAGKPGVRSQRHPATARTGPHGDGLHQHGGHRVPQGRRAGERQGQVAPGHLPGARPAAHDRSGAADAAGGCLLSNGDTTLATRAGLSSANPLITTAALTGRSGRRACR